MTDLKKQKIVLVHPLGYQKDSAKRDISRIANIMPPLGLASIAAFLEQCGVDVSIIDCFAEPDADLLIRDLIVRERPGFIGMSCTTSNFLDGIRIAALAKKIDQHIKVVFGGTHVSAMKEQVLRDFPVVDFVVVGEGEETLADLILRSGEGLIQVKGLIYRERDGEIRFTGYRSKGVDLDTLSFPAYHKLKGYPHAYTLPIFNYPTTPNTSCISSRGCPYACSYCDRSVFRRSYRYNSAEYVYEHLRFLNRRFGIRHINFYDDQFTFNRKRVEDMMNMLIDRPLGMTFNCAVRAEHIDRDLLRLMKQAGCWMISLGIETGDETLLAQHRQNVDLSLIAEKIRDIHSSGIRTKGLLMIGLPGETEETIRKSMDYVFSLPIDDFNISRFTPYPGSPLYERINELGDFEEDWEKMDGLQFQFIPKGITKEKMEKMYRDFYVSHFKRPKVLLGYLAMIWKSPDSWIRFFRNAGSFLRFAKTCDRF